MVRLNLRDDQWERIQQTVDGAAMKQIVRGSDLVVSPLRYPWRNLPVEIGNRHEVFKELGEKSEQQNILIIRRLAWDPLCRLRKQSARVEYQQDLGSIRSIA